MNHQCQTDILLDFYSHTPDITDTVQCLDLYMYCIHFKFLHEVTHHVIERELCAEWVCSSFYVCMFNTML